MTGTEGGGLGPARVVLRPIANPLPLGFLGLAAGTLLVSGLQLGWLAADQGRAVALSLIAFTVPLQLLTSVLSFLGRDVAAATGMGILAGSWLSIALVTLESTPGSISDALGLLLLAAGVSMWVPAAAATAAKLVPALVLGTAGLRLLTTGLYELTGSPGVEHLAGLLGLLLCALGMYAALAMTLEDAHRRPVLPLGRRGAGRTALEGDLSAQARGIEAEAGVREQL